MSFDAIVIGTGFGATVAATRLAKKGKRVLMLERGTWWVTPEKLGKPPVSAKKPIPVWAKENNQPLQYWPRPDHREGLLDFFAAIRSDFNKEGLYQYSMFKQADILTASGVGGGSLIYSNVTVRPHAEVLQGIGLNLGDPEYQAAYAWMEEYRGKLNKVVTKIPLPGRDVSNLTTDDYLYLDRSRALRDAAADVAQRLGIQLPWAPLDLSVPSAPNVLAQVSADRTDYRFPLAIADDGSFQDLEMSAKFNAVSGQIDRAAGLVFRLKDANNYYVVRANALENNYRLYGVVNGRREQIAGASVQVPSGEWHELSIVCSGNSITCYFDGEKKIETTDDTFSEAGKVGLWTKADSVIYFDDLQVRAK